MNTTHMRAISVPAAIAALLFVQFLFAPSAFAATDYANSVEDYTPGTQKDGSAIVPSRTNPNEALSAPDGSFVSLGYGGELVLGFPLLMSGDLSVSVFETTNSPYPLEQAEVAVSTNPGGPWTIVGTADNMSDSTTLQVAQCFQYVRLVDTTDETLHNNASDGFDVDAVEANYDEECVVAEEPKKKYMGRGDVQIRTFSYAKVINSTHANAYTGGNTAGGSTAGDGGNGGSIMNNGEQDIDGATTGTGGNGGASAAGGLITAGAATADAMTRNVINTTDVSVDRCACEGRNKGDVRVSARSHTFLMNDTFAGAYTGDNRARGSYAGDGGNGGEVNNYTDSEADQTLDDVITGNGGQGGASDIGGTVQTESALSMATTENIPDRIRVRVSR